MKTMNVKILICTMLLGLMIESHCRSIFDLDIDDIELPFKLKGNKDEDSGMNKSEDKHEAQEEEEEYKPKPVLPYLTSKEPVKNVTKCHKANTDCSDGIKCCDDSYRCYRLMGKYACTAILLESLGALKASKQKQRDENIWDYIW